MSFRAKVHSTLSSNRSSTPQECCLYPSSARRPGRKTAMMESARASTTSTKKIRGTASKNAAKNPPSVPAITIPIYWVRNASFAKCRVGSSSAININGRQMRPPWASPMARRATIETGRPPNTQVAPAPSTYSIAMTSNHRLRGKKSLATPQSRMPTAVTACKAGSVRNSNAGAFSSDVDCVVRPTRCIRMIILATEAAEYAIVTHIKALQMPGDPGFPCSVLPGS